jgi:hypothetical protein
MVTDLMDEHMRHDRSQALAMLRPVIEDRTAVEENHVGEPAALVDRSREGEADPLKQAEQVELRFRPHFSQHFVGGEVIDSDDELAAEVSKLPRQTLECFRGESLEIGERGCFEAR